MSGYRCFNCHKGRMMGLQHKHHPGVAGGRWKKRAPKTPKTFLPNLHAAKIVVDGTPKRVKLCTKCLRKYKESVKVKVATVEEITVPVVASV
jgi:large subunit ribosomal protein L28